MFSFRVIDSSEKVDTEKLNRMQFETIGLIIKFFPAVEFSQYIHEFLWHSAQCIGGYTLKNCSSCNWCKKHKT